MISETQGGGVVCSVHFINIFLVQSVSQFCRMLDLSQVSPLNFPGRQFGDLPDIIFRALEMKKMQRKQNIILIRLAAGGWWIFKMFEWSGGKLSLRMTEFSNASQGG